jgi:hypothetical protein
MRNILVEYSPLKQMLTQAIRQSYAHLQEVSKGETLYAFGLFHDAEMSYFHATANTEEGLQSYIESQTRLAAASPAELRVRVRWSTSDWKYHLIGEDAFSKLTRSWKQTGMRVLPDFLPIWSN